MYLSYIKRSKTMDQTQKKKKRKEKYQQNIKVSSSCRRGVNIGIVLRWLSIGIILNIDVL